MPNPSPRIAKTIRIHMASGGFKRADLREALAETNPLDIAQGKRKPMSESALTRRLAGEHTWDIHELAVVADFIGVNLPDLIAETNADVPEPTEES